MGSMLPYMAASWIRHGLYSVRFSYMSLLTEPWRMPGVSCQLGWTCEPRVVPSPAAQRAKQLQRGLHRQVVPVGGAAQELGNQHESTILYHFFLNHINDNIIHININTIHINTYLAGQTPCREGARRVATDGTYPGGPGGWGTGAGTPSPGHDKCSSLLAGSVGWSASNKWE